MFFFYRNIAKGVGGGGQNRDSRLRGGIHVSVYMHINVCTMIVQNDNAQGGTKFSPPPKKKTLMVISGDRLKTETYFNILLEKQIRKLQII